MSKRRSLGLLALCLASCASTVQPAASPQQAADALRFYGDLRLRQENTTDVPGTEDRMRSRGRMRLGVNYQLDEELTIGARVVTGDRKDPNSPHATYGDGLEGIELSLDRAFLTYRPGAWEGAEITAGKFNHPFYRNQVYGELLWDADVQPEGMIARKSFKSIPGLQELELMLGGYALIEQSSGDDAYLVVSQLALRRRLSENLDGTLAAGYYHYTDVSPDGGGQLFADNRGNLTQDRDADGNADDFASDFGISNLILGLRWDGGALPLTFSAESIHNGRTRSGQSDAWAVGLALGEARKPGDWKAYYQLQDVERESVFSPFAQDDFVLATGHHSHVLGFQRQLTSKVGLHIWGLLSAPGDDPSDDDNRQRLRIDLNVKF
ncbi:MAG: hypothetical protein ACI8QC_000980 [Planctomycetota bacterium]|jgi:hypothetical protein